MPPSENCDDATFLRRVTIDIAGRLPTLDESNAFLADKTGNKRDKAIDRLLASPDYADNFANKWAALLRNKRNKETDKRGNYSFHRWIRSAFNSNVPYDQFARQILAASGDMLHNPPVAWYREVKTTQQQLEDTAQLFLGTRIQCAQCHHHLSKSGASMTTTVSPPSFQGWVANPGDYQVRRWCITSVALPRRPIRRTINLFNQLVLAPPHSNSTR